MFCKAKQETSQELHYHPASCIEEHPISCISNLWSCFKICDIATAKEDQSHEGWKWHLLQPFQTKYLEKLAILFYKINSVQEACDKCFAVHILEFEILQTKNETKNIRLLFFSFS